jgi:nucleoside 2-deoxyribosyltransferase
MKKIHKLFFAIPFDSATKSQYERISKALRTRYESFTTVIGTDEVGPSPTYNKIATYKAQNRELTKQFVNQIQSADIVVADLTHNNPNVHLELGIALTQNMNILRVTGRSLQELGFDIRNLEVFAYKDEKSLRDKITYYIDMFLKIKQLPISDEFPQLYFKEPSVLELRAKKQEKEVDWQSKCSHEFKMRDGAIRVEFEILQARNPDDWFGVLFRAGDNPFVGSQLVYVRQDGRIGIVEYPGAIPVKTDENRREFTGRQTLEIEFENDYCCAKIDGSVLTTENLSYQAPGRVFQAALHADVNVYSVEMIRRDTIEW